MTTSENSSEETEPKERIAHPFRTLRELVDFVSGKSFPSAQNQKKGCLPKLCPSLSLPLSVKRR